MSDYFSKKVAVVAHDAGGAEILSSLVIEKNLQCSYALAGPALKIFNRKLGSIAVMSLDKAIDRSDWLLCGTSWQSDLEWNAIKSAKLHRKFSAAFLDHWAHYRERFVRDGIEIYPDEIWVGDAHAEVLAKSILPNIKLRRLENPYFEDLKTEILAVQTKDLGAYKSDFTVLFVSEPLREGGKLMFGDENYSGYSEEEALHYFLSNLHVFKRQVDKIIIRPHPSEPFDKYKWVKSKYDLPIVIGGGEALLDEIAMCDVVVGLQSMALVIGLIAGKRVISCIPPQGKSLTLPQLEIESLNTLIQQLQ